MQCFPGATFQKDNGWPHTARVSQDCLHTVTILSQPARSPYLFPIEHIWDHLGCAGDPGRPVCSLTKLEEVSYQNVMCLGSRKLLDEKTQLIAWIFGRLSPYPGSQSVLVPTLHK
ncbi:hypothetical protein TNCV_3823761 [Trichonephila clavipes]|nr:hypothetical protein TNCV_3823761 [Trichonephila clavipes]